MFEAGDVVKLKTGGPLMTVNRLSKVVNTDTYRVEVTGVVCAWFDPTETALHSGGFSMEALVKREVK